jgi:hypothetical protein
MISETSRVHLIPKFLVKSLKKIIFRFKKSKIIFLPILYPSQPRKCKKHDQKRFSEDLEKKIQIYLKISNFLALDGLAGRLSSASTRWPGDGLQHIYKI